MNEKKEAQKVKAVVGFITADLHLINEVSLHLKELLGEVDCQSPIIDFHFTNYYEKEMGPGLKRQWVSFQNLIKPDFLADLKMKTNSIEEMFMYPNRTKKRRRINIDPGILTLSNFILASTKNYAHRIYLKNGIYAEVTLVYKKKIFQTLEWTYPDYRTEVFVNFLTEVRKIYLDDLKNLVNL